MKLCGYDVDNDQPIFLIAGTCVVEDEAMSLDVAGTLKEICASLAVPYIYKSSFDKANRSSRSGFRGPGMEEGLRVLAEVRRQIDVPVLTDVHEDTPMDEVADVVIDAHEQLIKADARNEKVFGRVVEGLKAHRQR